MFPADALKAREFNKSAVQQSAIAFKLASALFQQFKTQEAAGNNREIAGIVIALLVVVFTVVVVAVVTGYLAYRHKGYVQCHDKKQLIINAFYPKAGHGLQTMLC